MLHLVDDGDGVLLLTDIFGATPSNLALKLLEPGRVEGLTGVNLPMLLRALNYRDGHGHPARACPRRRPRWHSQHAGPLRPELNSC
jgi:mannose/fructose-specific phosphotransferase system component IIA